MHRQACSIYVPSQIHVDPGQLLGVSGFEQGQPMVKVILSLSVCLWVKNEPYVVYSTSWLVIVETAAVPPSKIHWNQGFRQ